MKKYLFHLISKRYKVMVSGELERTTDFLGLLKLLHGYSDFHQYTKKEQRDFIKESIKNKQVYIDANITCKIIN